VTAPKTTNYLMGKKLKST